MEGRQAGLSLLSLPQMVFHGALCVFGDIFAPEASGITHAEGMGTGLMGVVMDPSQFH